MHTHTCAHAHTPTHTHAHTHAHKCTHTQTPTQTHRHTCTHTHIHTCVHTHTHTHMRAPTRISRWNKLLSVFSPLPNVSLLRFRRFVSDAACHVHRWYSQHWRDQQSEQASVAGTSAKFLSNTNTIWLPNTLKFGRSRLEVELS